MMFSLKSVNVISIHMGNCSTQCCIANLYLKIQLLYCENVYANELSQIDLNQYHAIL